MGPKKQAKGRASSAGSVQKRASEKKTDFTLGGWDDDIDSDEGGEDEDSADNRGKGKSKSKGVKRSERSDDDSGKDGASDSDDDDARETAEQKRRRLAKEYLARMEADNENEEASSSGADSGDDDDFNDGNKDSTLLAGSGASADRKRQALSVRLRKNRLDAGGKYFRDLSTAAQAYSAEIQDTPLIAMGGHDSSVTAVALATDESFAVSGSKDNSVLRWDVETQQKQILRAKWRRDTHFEKQSCEGEVLAVAISSDGRYSVSAGTDKTVRIFDSRQAYAEVKAFTGHGASVTSLAFRRDSYSLFSASHDRCLKYWDLSEMGYIETLFGHQDAVNAVDCWTKERPISVSSDRTVRYWKVVDESHLVFRGHKSSADAVQLLTDETFLTGGQCGSLHLWRESQKKPVVTVANAHGFQAESLQNPNWIAAIASVKMSNLAATGSNDGFIRLWDANADSRSLRQVSSIPVSGFVNAIAMSPRLIVAGTGREHRMGRWWCEKGSKNKVAFIRLPRDLDAAVGSEEEEDEDEDEEEEDGNDSSSADQVNGDKEEDEEEEEEEEEE